MSDPFNQIRRYTALSYPDFVKAQLNDSTKMFCNLKTSHETAIMIEVFRGLQKQPLEVFYKKGVLRNFAKFTGKHLENTRKTGKQPNTRKTALRPATLFKKSLWHRCFSVNFAKFLRTPFLQNTSGRRFLVLASFTV